VSLQDDDDATLSVTEAVFSQAFSSLSGPRPTVPNSNAPDAVAARNGGFVLLRWRVQLAAALARASRLPYRARRALLLRKPPLLSQPVWLPNPYPNPRRKGRRKRGPLDTAQPQPRFGVNFRRRRVRALP
jgi:hypothetical protein